MARAPWIFDADRHVMEPLDMWPRYLDPALRNEAPRLIDEVASGLSGTLADRVARLGSGGALPPLPRAGWRGRPVARTVSPVERATLDRLAWSRLNAIYEASHGPGQLASMDRQAIAGAALMPTYASFLVGTEDMPDAIAHGFAEAYNRWLADVCAADPLRLVPVGLIARHDPARMVASLDALIDRGWRSVVLRPEPVRGRTLGHPDLAPFWARCAEADVLVTLHGGSRARLPTAGTERFSSQFGLHACAHGLEAMMALVALVDGGVLHAHPTLRVVILEAGCTWLPHWLWRLDEAWQIASMVARRARPEPPSVTVRRSCTLGFDPSEPLLLETIADIGADQLVFGSDFPHLDHDEALVQQAVARLGGLAEPAFRELMAGNGARLFGWCPPPTSQQKQKVENGKASPVSQ